MDDARKAMLAAELDTAVRQRDQLNVVIEYLSGLIGRSPTEQSGVDKDSEAKPNVAANPVDLVGEGEFFGKSSTEAAGEVLTRVGRTRPLKTQAIFEAVTKGGVKVATPDALYRGLFRNSKFTKVGKSLWGLTEWYPAAAVKAAKNDRDPEAASLGLADEDSGEESETDLAGQEAEAEEVAAP